MSLSYCFRFVTRCCAHAQERSCSFALRYTCGDGFNENDLHHFTDALNEQLAEGNTYTTLVILANEGDHWEHPAQVVHSPKARRRSWARPRARRGRCRTR